MRCKSLFVSAFFKVVIELRAVQFWSEIILVISNPTRVARSFDFEITSMISGQIALHSVQLPLLIMQKPIITQPKQPKGVTSNKSIKKAKKDLMTIF